jgi:hypothetical protein
MGVKVDQIILQVSRPEDRSDQEIDIAEQGLIPIVLFANGPENAYLFGARREDVDSAFGVSIDLADGLGAERLAVRLRLFEGLAYAIETDMRSLADPSDFPNDAMALFIEAMQQFGLEDSGQLRPCAVRFVRGDLESPDLEAAPGDAEQEPAEEMGEA